MKPIIGDTEFFTNLDDWLFKNTQPSAKWIHQNKLGMDDLSVDSAMTEKEILCAPGIKLSMKDIYRL